MAAFGHRTMRLFGCDFYDLCLAEIERDHLLAKTFPHLDFDCIWERSTAPIIVARRQDELFPGVPLRDAKRPGAGNLRTVTFDDAVAWQSQLGRKIRSRRVTLDDDSLSFREYFPGWIRPPQGCSYYVRSNWSSVLESDTTAQEKLPALAAGFRLPGTR